MARITDLRTGSDGNIREAELVTSTRRTIHRPVNLLIPLEIQEHTDHQPTEFADDTSTAATPPTIAPHRYNLRPRNRRPVQPTISIIQTHPTRHTRKWFLFHLMLFSLLTLGATKPSTNMHITCTNNGVLVSTTANHSFQICADNHCEFHVALKNPYLVKFPAHSTLHDHVIMLKWNTEGQLSTMTTVCPALDFCENLDCWFCIPVLLNPECWPMGALFLAMLLLYLAVATLYLLLYVPMTIGKPIRLLLQGAATILLFFICNLGKLCLILFRRVGSRRRPTRSERFAAALAVVACLASQYHVWATACQHVNVFEHHATLCTTSNGQERCQVALTELLKINTFHREACLRLTHNSTLVANIRVRWKGLYLRCEQETIYFTRATSLHVMDSKRCPHMGSCVNGKCADVSTSSLIPELHPANQFTGRTGCLESCGGLGCDCFYPSSGRLFYRIYAVPRSPTVYEAFRCLRWSEQVKLEVTIDTTHPFKASHRFVETAAPNIPIILPSLRVTMTSLSLPPIPSLNTDFITDGHDTSLWTSTLKPHLLCISKENATSAQCAFTEDWQCDAAESKVKCHCSGFPIEREFSKVERKLPLKTASWELSQRHDHTIIAKIPSMVSAEFVINFNDTYDTSSLLIHHDRCTI
ncbi:hypothetical protein ANCCAN_22331 [Ancylostoma caninum]|uniref:Phlebovirus glycoprotein G2 fusion domain-containing protein n=1 Tax=Ancylostoma caninum TaxID=29170 RepID=A0A368FM42_ANCCA|nr:hypothetical protein ANCCAN_22331 [Ancylostoma caninum]